LFPDATVSLFRQWVLRPEFRHTELDGPIPVTSGDVPVLASLDSYTPRPATILIGCLLSVAFFSAVVTASIPTGKLSSWLIGVHQARESVLSVSRSSHVESEPNTLVQLGEEPENLWRAVASVYFKSMPVLGALDANDDFVISSREIIAAPAALQRLDLNHDGRLSPEECGLSLGLRSQGVPDPQLLREAQREFMRSHPVLAAIDADHDGEISAEEIRNSFRYLRTLDRNGDGFLTPNEVMPVHTESPRM
jgi:Ca2+-binding EF-hand superfamily protein